MSITTGPFGGRGRVAPTASGEAGPAPVPRAVTFEARLVGIGEASGFDLADYAGQDLMIFVATPEEIRKAAPIFRGPTRLHAETPAIVAALDMLAMLKKNEAFINDQYGHSEDLAELQALIAKAEGR